MHGPMCGSNLSIIARRRAVGGPRLPTSAMSMMWTTRPSGGTTLDQSHVVDHGEDLAVKLGECDSREVTRRGEVVEVSPAARLSGCWRREQPVVDLLARGVT